MAIIYGRKIGFIIGSGGTSGTVPEKPAEWQWYQTITDASATYTADVDRWLRLHVIGNGGNGGAGGRGTSNEEDGYTDYGYGGNGGGGGTGG